MPTLRAGQTVTIVRRVLQPEPDSHGNDVYVDQLISVLGCAISPGFSSETDSGGIQVKANVTIHMPTGTVVYPTDALRGPDGREYEVIGFPDTWQSPFTGTLSMVEVKVQEVTGGGSV